MHWQLGTICLPGPRLRKLTGTSSGSRNLPVAQPGTDVMRDVLRLVDVLVDLLQNCNGPRSTRTIAHWQADDLLKRVVRHGGLLIRHDELPSRVAALRGGDRGLPPQESEGDMYTAVGRTATLKRQLVELGLLIVLMISSYTLKTSGCRRSTGGYCGTPQVLLVTFSASTLFQTRRGT
jgi:hypothetical protein